VFDRSNRIYSPAQPGNICDIGEVEDWRFQIPNSRFMRAAVASWACIWNLESRIWNSKYRPRVSRRFREKVPGSTGTRPLRAGTRADTVTADAMAPQTRADYEQLAKIAQQFAAEADTITQQTQRVRSTVDTLRGGDWVGKAAEAFYREMDSSVFPSLARLIKALNAASGVTGEISKDVQQTEREIADVLKQDEAVAEGSGGSEGSESSGGGGGFWSGVWDGVKSVAGGAWEGLKQVGGFVEGFVLGAVDMVQGLWTLVTTNPIDTAKNLWYAVTHPGEAWDAIKKPFVEDWESGNYGRAFGRGAFELVGLFAGGAGAVGKGGKVASVMDKISDAARVADKAADVAKLADKAADVGKTADKISDVGKAADKAADAGKVADDIVAARKLEVPETFADPSKAARVPDIMANTTPYKADKVLPQQAADDIAKLSTHGSGDRVVLGKWEGYDSPNFDNGYLTQAKKNGGVYFETPNGWYDELGDKASGVDRAAKSFQVNESFLRQQLESGVKRIEYVGEDVNDVLRAGDKALREGKSTRASFKEITYLQKNAAAYGYTYDAATQAWIKTRPSTATINTVVGGAGATMTAGTVVDRVDGIAEDGGN
jgi:WXG100 family type VII secretion target